MSTAAAQNNNIYFDCGDKNYTVNNAPDKNHNEREANGGSMNQITSSMDVVSSDGICQKLHHYKDNDQFRIHGTLTRTISQPQHDANVTSLVCSLMENLGNMNLHRKLERTQSEPIPQHVNTSRYKTELCRPFEEAGECKYGEKCQFAHGYHELRNLQRHPKYKTEYCRTFHSVGFCPYGPRCHFVHNADEARALQQQNHSSFNSGVPTYTSTKQSNGALKHSLPLSPPLSMSTGSDRESPTGSLSVSPTNSITSFQFNEQKGPENTTFHSAFSYVNTPPDSPNAPISPVNTPPITDVLGAMQNQTQIYIKPINVQSKENVPKENTNSIALVKIANNNKTKVTLTSVNGEETRLPVFNRLSSAVDNLSDIAL